MHMASKQKALLGSLAAAALMLGVSACGRGNREHVPEDLARRCVLLEHNGGDPDAQRWQAWSRLQLPDARRLPISRLEEAASECLASDLLLVLPGTAVPEEARTLLEDFLSRGARMLVLGRHPPLATANFGDRSFSVTSTALRVRGEKKSFASKSQSVWSPFPAPAGAGGEHAGPGRWIPVIEALGSHGGAIAWPGSVQLTPQPGTGYSITGWLALDPEDEEDRSLVPAVAAMIRETTRHIYLHRYGLPQHAVRSGVPLHVSARLIDRRLRDLSPLRLSAEWITRSGQELRRHVSPPLDEAGLAVNLQVGIAPEPSSGKPEIFRVRLRVRDRADQVTHDEVIQTIKVFPREHRGPDVEPVSVSSDRLMQGRRPLFMLGVNYWPRISGPPLAQSPSGHWLDPQFFDPDIVTSDLDILVAAGINAIAIEYTDILQAPQLEFVLEELRRRSMWASLYVPALYPLDPRLEEALRMLDAIHLSNWPEVFALELARGLAVRPRDERRHLDPAWLDWLEEHFNSPSEAEQKLGLSLWRERGRYAGPPDAQLRQGPHRDRALALYYTFLRDYASRRMGHIRRTLRSSGYNVLLTARSAYGWPGQQPDNILDVLDISTGNLHQDFLSPDAWLIHPLRIMHPDGKTMSAYLRGAGPDKPVLWSAFGQRTGLNEDPSALQRQKEVYRHFLNLFLSEGAAGAFAWWYPPVKVASANMDDWGLVMPSGSWRPVEEVFRATRLKLRQTRLRTPEGDRHTAPLIQSAMQLENEMNARAGLFAAADAQAAAVWDLAGSGLDSSILLNPHPGLRWTEIDGLHMLNAEWGSVLVDRNPLTRDPGESVRCYVGQRLQLELINSGTVRWTGSRDRKQGTIWVRASQPGQPDDWIAIESQGPGSNIDAAWTPRDPGPWELQPYLIGYGKFGERLRLEVTTPPRLF